MNGLRSGTSGVRRVMLFNWPKLVATLALTVGLILVGRGTDSRLVRSAAVVGALAPAYFLVASLVASWWVYDRSDLLTWRWLERLLPDEPHRWALVHAGYDEAGPALTDALGDPCAIVDVSPRLGRISPSLHRARRRHPAGSTVVADADADTPLLPIAPTSCDGVLLVFAAHEVRDRGQREELFDELQRVLAPAGRVVVVEHLRDRSNLAVFGLGAFHFQSRREWQHLAGRSGFDVAEEVTKTAFVRGFALCKT